MSDKTKICRICLKAGIRPVNIFQTVLCDDLVANLLIDCADVEVFQGDGCPEIVCSACINSLEQAYSFKRLIKRSDDILKELAEQETVEYLLPDKGETDTEMQQIDNSIIQYEEETVERGTYVTLKIEPDNEAGIIGGDEVADVEEENMELPRWMTNPMPEASDSSLNCCMCSQEFEDIVSLKVHCSTEHDINPDAEPPRKRSMKYACHTCNQKVFACLSQLQKHQKAFAKTICSVCGLSFLQSKLQKHIALKHGPKKPIEHVLCEICNSYVRTTQFSVHRKSHVGELKYECDVCGKKFRVRNYLKMHLERHFPSLRPPKQMKVACMECGKMFVHPSKLLQHAIIHTDVKPLKCLHCDQTFKDYTDRRRHTWLVHTGSPYTCDNCQKPFDRPSTLKKHQMSCKKIIYEVVTADGEFVEQYPDYL